MVRTILIVAAFVGLVAVWSGLFFTSIYPGLAVGATAVGVILLGIGAILGLLSLGRQAGQPKDKAWQGVLLAAVLIGGPVNAADVLRAVELEWNQGRARSVGLALRQYNQDNGRYPREAAELQPRYMASIPWCWYGLAPRPFDYWLDGYEKPHIQIVVSPTDTLSYDVEHARWSKGRR